MNALLSFQRLSIGAFTQSENGQLIVESVTLPFSLYCGRIRFLSAASVLKNIAPILFIIIWHIVLTEFLFPKLVMNIQP